MALAKHHEEILEKIIANYDALKADADLPALINNTNKEWSSRLSGYKDVQIDPNGPKYDIERVTLNIIKALYEKTKKLESDSDKLSKDIQILEEKLLRSRQSMKNSYKDEIRKLKKEILNLRCGIS